MRFRRTKTHHDAHGQPRYSVRLVKSQRHGERVKQITLLNLGTHWSVPQTLWAAVARRVEEILASQETLWDGGDPAVDAAAEEVVGLLRSRGFQLATPSTAVAEVDLDTLDHPETRFVGGERLCRHAWDDLRLGKCLEQQGFSPRDTRIAVALLMAKMLHPASERETSRWLRHDSATAELLGLDGDIKALSRKTLTRIGDRLWKAREAIQTALFARERTLLDLSNTRVFYDLSNTYYTGRKKAPDVKKKTETENNAQKAAEPGAMEKPDQPANQATQAHEVSGETSKLPFGRSKQRRNDCPLITLGLMLDEAGFPRACEFLPGNLSEGQTLQDAVRRFEAQGHGPEGIKPTVVMDAGLSAEDNLDWLTAQGYPWICVAKGSKPSQAPSGAPDLIHTTQADHTVRVWQWDSDGTETRLYVMSEGRQQTARSIRDRQGVKFEQGLQQLHDHRSLPRRMKQYERVVEAVGRLKERHPGLARHYDIQVHRGDGDKAKAVTFTRKASFDQSDDLLGACIMRTSHTDWDLETTLRTYHRLTDIEEVFRELKGELGLRPIWHTREDRIQAHLFIAVLAYHAVQLIRTRLRAAGIALRWQSIRQRLRPWMRITTTLQTVNGEQIVTRQDGRATVEQAEIVKAAGGTTRLASGAYQTVCVTIPRPRGRMIARQKVTKMWGQWAGV